MNAVSATMSLLLSSGTLRPGDCVLVRNGERGPLNAGIRYAQRAGLENLSGEGWDPEQVAEAATYTHAAVVFNESLMGEQYYPHARLRRWDAVCADMLFRRPAELISDTPDHRQAGMQIAAEAAEDVLRETPYASGELLWYWFRFGGLKLIPNALGWKTKFANVFRSKRYNTCAAEYVRWCHGAGVHVDGIPESWYPARLAIDTNDFVTVGRLTAAGHW